MHCFLNTSLVSASADSVFRTEIGESSQGTWFTLPSPLCVHASTMHTFCDEIVVQVLLFLDDPLTRRAMRSASASVQRAGEMSRHAVESRQKRLNGKPLGHPELYWRMLWWSPWRGVITIRSPCPTSHPAAICRLEELHGLRQVYRTHSLHQRAVMLHGRSDSCILFKAYVKDTWCWQHLVY